MHPAAALRLQGPCGNLLLTEAEVSTASTGELRGKKNSSISGEEVRKPGIQETELGKRRRAWPVNSLAEASSLAAPRPEHCNSALGTQPGSLGPLPPSDPKVSTGSIHLLKQPVTSSQLCNNNLVQLHVFRCKYD